MKTVLLIRSNPIDPDPPVEKMADTLMELGFNVLILAWDRDDNYYVRETTLETMHGSALIYRFGIKAEFGGGIKKNLKPLCEFEKRISKWMKNNSSSFDIIHSFDFDTGFISMRIAKKFNKKYVYHILDYYIDSHKFGSGFIRDVIKKEENKIISFADATIICTDKRKIQIKDSRPKSLYVIHNTPDSASFIYPNRVIQSLSNDKMKIVYVGILVKSRMLLELCDLVADNDLYELHIGGFGNLEEEIKNYSNEYSNIFFYGKLPYEKTLKLEEECDVMVAIYNPSNVNNQYSAPNKFYESLMIGKPIIMSIDTGFDDVIDEYGIGETIDYSKEGIKDGLNRIYKRKNEWITIHHTSQKLYHDSFSWDNMKQRIASIYNSISV